MELPGLTPEECAVFEWQYRYCSDFKTALWRVICTADDGNLTLLGKGFPLQVHAYELYTQVNGWWQSVQTKAHKLGYLKEEEE